LVAFLVRIVLLKISRFPALQKGFFIFTLLAGFVSGYHSFCLPLDSARSEVRLNHALGTWEQTGTNDGHFYTKEEWSQYPPEAVKRHWESLVCARDLRGYYHNAQGWAFWSAILLMVSSYSGLCVLRKRTQATTNSVKSTSPPSASSGG
jgi:hypothetical protein